MRRTPFILVLLVLCAAGCVRAPEPKQPESLAKASAEELFARGIALANEGEYVAAEQYLQVARAAGFPERKAVIETVKVCLAANRLQRGLSYALPYVQTHPGDWQLRQVVASLYFAMGEPRLARQQLLDVIAIRPSLAQSHYLLGVILRDDYHDMVAARASFERYLASAPGGRHAAEVRAWLARRPIANTEDSVEVIQ